MKRQLNIRHIITLVTILFFTVEVHAQQDAQYTQFMYNKLPQNAAYTGSREVLSIRALYRSQWVGNKNGGTYKAPQTASFSIHSPLKNDHFALGFYFVNDRLGMEHKNQFNATFAYRIALGKKVKLSLGINAGIYWYKWNATNEVAIDGGDPLLQQNVSRVLPDVGAGLYVYHPNFYVGASIPNFVKGDLSAKNAASSAKRVPHFVAMAGGAIPLGNAKALYLRPQIQYRYLAVSQNQYSMPHTFDLNLSLLIYNRVNIGGQYRTSFGNRKNPDKLYNGDSFNAMVEVWPIKQLLIGYSYDYTLSKLNTFNTGSHEIILGYDLGFQKKKAVTPRYF